ncbi:MAG TPA: hypothetical protein VN838_00665 [Bradyrhizobium sp.]|nr:hypothetical protein [Bradyrhizobium sp.]
MPRQPPVKVTFDTNTLSGVIDLDQSLGKADHTAYQAVHAVVKTGQMRGFFSEALVTLDAIGRKAKAEILGAARFMSEAASTGPNQITITLGPRWKRVDIDHRIQTRIETALAMGMRGLIGPRRFGDSPVVRGFGEGFYEPYPSGAAFVAAVDKANALDAAIVARGLGRAQVIELGKFFSERDGADGEWWPQGLGRIRSDAERKKVGLAINEWADGEALAAHAGYGNDLFCTNDRGRDLGDRSILHPNHRAWLSETHGVTIVNVAELAKRLATAP